MDPKFLKWLGAVSPSEAVAERLTVSVDWNTVLEILLAIFKLLAMFGCLAARSYSKRVKEVLATYASTPTRGAREIALCTARLMEIRDEMERSKKKKEIQMRSLFLILALLPSLLFAKGGVQVDFKGHQFLYSPKLQKRFYLGLKSHPKPTATLKSFAGLDVKVPNDFSWKDLKGLPPGFPLDQGQCGSCVVNSIVGNMTFNLWIRGLLPDAVSPLSRGQVMNCNPTAGQCDGDWAENVGGWVVKHGGRILSESVYPYSPNSGSCRNKTGTEYSESYAISGGSVVDNSEESIGKGLVTSGPLSTTVGADNAWMNAGKSVYTTCTNQGTNHEVLIIGIHCRGAAHGADGFCNFAAAKPGDVVIDILNSWGDWADGGIIHTVVRGASGRLCNNVTEEVYAFELPPLSEPASCSVEASPKSVQYGGSVALTVTSKNAKTALVDGQTVAVPQGSVTETAAPGGALPQTVAIHAFATGADGKQVACTGDTAYTVTAAPAPTPGGGSLTWLYVLGAVVLAALAFFLGKKSK